MEEVIIKYLNKALDFESKGYIDEAVALYDRLLVAVPDSVEIILTEKAKLEFRNMRDKEALLDFIQAYAVDRNEELYDLVIEAYLNPNRKMLEAQYQENLHILEKYPYYWNDFSLEEMELYVLWMDTEVICAVNVQEKAFAVLPHCGIEEQEQEDISFMLINQLYLSEICCYKDKIKKKQPFFDEEVPYYLIYDRNFWMLFAQTADLKELLKEKRVVFLIGRKSFCSYLEDSYVVSPKKIINFGSHEEYETLFGTIMEHKVKKMEEYKRGNAAYYQAHGQEVIQNIQNGKPRILFITSRFTSVLQYHTRDCMQAAQRMGCRTRLLIEPDGIHRMTLLSKEEEISDFKPDIIFCIDHFRYEYNVPDHVVWITWVQDPMPLVMDKKSPGKLKSRDFVMTHYTSWKDFDAIGYSKECLIEAPIPANSYIYRPYLLTCEEREKFSCDICFVCHASDVDSYIESVVAAYPERVQDMIYALHKGYQAYVCESGKLFFSQEEFRKFIDGAMIQNFEIKVSDEYLDTMSKDMWLGFNQRVYRQALVDWIIEAGFTNLKLWGNGWKDNVKYKEYAMGPAENGEVLSKIYQSSKIVIGNNVGTSAAARAWETMLSGGFYMANYIPPEEDGVDIRKIMKVDEELVVFHEREDLIEKIQFYLTNEKERQRMSLIGHKAALERMTFDKTMQRVIKEVGKRLEEGGV